MAKITITKQLVRKTLKQVAEIINASEEPELRADHRQQANARAFRDVITFLRGPDNEAYLLKQLTTARVRGTIGINRNSGLIATEGEAIHTVERIIAEMEDKTWQVHHRSHYARAKRGLEWLGYIKVEVK